MESITLKIPGTHAQNAASHDSESDVLLLTIPY